MENFISIGVIQRAHGLNGEVKVEIEKTFADLFRSSEALFLEQKGRMIPYFVEYIRTDNSVVLKFEDVDGREAAQALAKNEIYVPESEVDFSLMEESETPLHAYVRFEGFRIVDHTEGPIGIIERVIEMPQQIMALVNYREREVLIPLNSTFIRSTDEAQRILLMDLPEGLLEL